MTAIDLDTLLTLIGLSLATATCAVGGLIWIAGRMHPVPVLPRAAAPGQTPARSAAVALPDPAPVDQDELALLRSALAQTAALQWQRDADGALRWANPAYQALVAKVDPDAARRWPLPDLFAEFLPRGLPGAPTHRRASVSLPDGTRHWFAVEATDTGTMLLCSALPIDGQVAAEDKTRRMMQSLTQTFAHLRTGLAIFDRDRRLIMFNPALIDLTGLEADWLANRPTLATVFDTLRNRNALPEPKDYKGWLDRLHQIETQAENGQFDEVWSLPDGRVYRVCARPHPEGGLAFLIEDISDEMALTRRFRAELELGQSVINAVEDAIVVFSPTGTQLMVNRAYADLWQLDEAGTDMPATAPSIVDAQRVWQTVAGPAQVWGDIREFVIGVGPRADWTETARLADGTALACRMQALGGGATLISFRQADEVPIFRPRAALEARTN